MIKKNTSMILLAFLISSFLSSGMPSQITFEKDGSALSIPVESGSLYKLEKSLNMVQWELVTTLKVGAKANDIVYNIPATEERTFYRYRTIDPQATSIGKAEKGLPRPPQMLLLHKRESIEVFNDLFANVLESFGESSDSNAHLESPEFPKPEPPAIKKSQAAEEDKVEGAGNTSDSISENDSITSLIGGVMSTLIDYITDTLKDVSSNTSDLETETKDSETNSAKPEQPEQPEESESKPTEKPVSETDPFYDQHGNWIGDNWRDDDFSSDNDPLYDDYGNWIGDDWMDDDTWESNFDNDWIGDRWIDKL